MENHKYLIYVLIFLILFMGGMIVYLYNKRLKLVKINKVIRERVNV